MSPSSSAGYSVIFLLALLSFASLHASFVDGQRRLVVDDQQLRRQFDSPIQEMMNSKDEVQTMKKHLHPAEADAQRRSASASPGGINGADHHHHRDQRLIKERLMKSPSFSTWTVPKNKRSRSDDEHLGFNNLDYSPPKAHPPHHN
ncbi:Root meristem growth factor 10 [Linum perenne]